MSKIVNFPGCEAPEEIQDGEKHGVEKCLEIAGERDLGEIFIIGRKKDGDFWFSTNNGDVGDMLFLIETAKAILMKESLGG